MIILTILICLSVFARISRSISPLESLPQSSLFLLKDVRSDLKFPELSLQEKIKIVNQTRSIFSIYIHRGSRLFNGLDDLENVLDSLKNLTQEEFQLSMHSIYLNLHDIQQQYVFPVPFSCSKIIIPLEFGRIQGDNTSLFTFAVKEKRDLYKKFGVGWLDGINLGDVLISVDGIIIEDLQVYFPELFINANKEAVIARWIQKVTFRFDCGFNNL